MTDTGARKDPPQLEGDALGAVEHRGSHLQIIASAGSGKTEVVSQRVVSLLAEGVPPEGIVAFTFTERAADELKKRIVERVDHRLGSSAIDRLNGLFVGTIHAYCFRLLQQHVPRYETFDVLDDKQLTAFLAREGHRLDLRQLDPNQRLFASIRLFLTSVDVIENELLDPQAMPEPFRTVVSDYYDTLERYRLLTYGQQIARTVTEMDAGSLLESVRPTLRHLIVDEYQDVNPAQERLIELLVGPDVELCVVGDDQQAIYQWRGSDVHNILEFRDRYPGAAEFKITTNYRSRPDLIAAANAFAETIPERLEKEMYPARPSAGDAPEIAVWTADTEADEAGYITNLVAELQDRGVPLSDVAILVRSRAAYRALVESFAAFDIPVQPGGRTGLFEQPEAVVIGQTFCWLVDEDWRMNQGQGAPVVGRALVADYTRIFELTDERRRGLAQLLRDWKIAVPKENRVADLVGELYALLDELDVKSWDLSLNTSVNRLGVLARFTALLADYESVRRRSRPDPDNPGEQVGGQDRGNWYYRNLARHIVNFASGAYEDFDGEADFALNAVDLTTIHRAKGLEWPAVFVPSLTARRFPTQQTGRPGNWLVPRDMFDAPRYEGSDADERRLFYVAMTRARDWLSVSRHARVTTRTGPPSPYYLDLLEHQVNPDDIELPPIETTGGPDADTIAVTFSELAAFIDCGLAYRLRNLVGFQPRLAPELGYGKAIHHVMRRVAEETRTTGKIPTPAELDELLDSSFYLPTANKPAHRQMKQAARRLLDRYTTEHESDLYRVWETERPFELHLDGVVVSGRADVILDREGGVETALAIVDYKTSTSGEVDDYALQLQVYADAGRREGLDVAAAYLHDLKASDRATVGVEATDIASAERTVIHAARRMRDRDFSPQPGAKCAGCDVRTLCRHAR